MALGKPAAERRSKRTSLMQIQNNIISAAKDALNSIDTNIMPQKHKKKEERERYVVQRFKFEELRLEQIQDLENDMMKYFREDLHRWLLSIGFKKQVDGIEMLHKVLPSITKEIIEVLDILSRWFVLQFCKSNTTCLLKVLEFLLELFDALKDEGHSLIES